MSQTRGGGGSSGSRGTTVRPSRARGGSGSPRGGRQASPRPRGDAPRKRRAAPPKRRRRRPVRLGLGHPHRRVRFILIAVLFVFSLFGAQLLRLQALDASSMANAALGNRLRTVAVPAMRGNITDSDGTVLATSVERRDITADPTAVPEYRKNATSGPKGIEAAAQAMAPLVGKTPEALATRLTSATGRFTYLVKDVSPLTWRKVAALGIPGIYSQPTTKRLYPLGSTAAALTGWVGADGSPGGGLELMMNKVLTGKPGTDTYERSADGRVIPTGEHHVVPAVPGRNVRTTLNSDLQFYAENALAEQVKKSGAVSGTIVVMDRTGHLRAVGSYPTFDPTNIGQASGDLTSRAFDETFEPGSTAKVMTIAASLEEGVATPTTEVTVPPRLQRAGTSFKDAENHGTERLTVAGVLAHSSNMGTILVGEQVKPKVMHNYFQKFGLGQKTGIGFPGETGGLLPPASDWKSSRRYTVLFGQGFSVNAIQDMGVFQTIANGGVRVPPTLIAGTKGPDGSFHPTPHKKPVRVVSSSVAEQMRQMMETVVGKHGTAPAAEVSGYRVAGKTGTADRYDPATGGYNGYTASFVGFAPADNPQLIVGVVLQDPKSSIYGGVVAAPVFSDVMRYALQEYGIPPTGTKPAPLPLTVQERNQLARKKSHHQQEPRP
ncbi:MAG TPA: penicillin-binding protein 2 [Segeticoccus sp.]|uniref:peptidoglycan D,D-transpeptidase FtsI family protein n=1 Tax=Segeticoccus sp. TaxID=2706531 RepID=UPI002D7EC73D|nr:penicillin-binding protein 2 [Segeticoccus sp.]HET8601886.1 penicillin-binding protein 2 [Segeticoccus sp.]